MDESSLPSSSPSSHGRKVSEDPIPGDLSRGEFRRCSSPTRQRGGGKELVAVRRIRVCRLCVTGRWIAASRHLARGPEFPRQNNSDLKIRNLATVRGDLDVNLPFCKVFGRYFFEISGSAFAFAIPSHRRIPSIAARRGFGAGHGCLKGFPAAKVSGCVYMQRLWTAERTSLVFSVGGGKKIRARQIVPRRCSCGAP